MSQKKENGAIALSLFLVVGFWGGNNAGTKWLLGNWPPVFTGCLRFAVAGVILLGNDKKPNPRGNLPAEFAVFHTAKTDKTFGFGNSLNVV